MCSRYEQFFFASIKDTFHKDNSSNKLRSYCKFKPTGTYTFENYFAVKADKISITKYAKLGISNQNELGWYAKTPVHLRTCNICNTLELKMSIILYVYGITRASARRDANTPSRRHFLMYKNNLSL